MAINRTSIEIVKHLAVATKICFKSQDTNTYEITNIVGSYVIPETRTRKQFTPIHLAAEFGNLDLIHRTCIRKNMQKNSIWKCDDNTPRK